MKFIRRPLFRARVNAAIERACNYPVAMILGPAGFGKSVALTDFLENGRVRFVRHNVRPDENSLLAFVRGLSETIAPVAPSAAASFANAQQLAVAVADPARELAAWFYEHVRFLNHTIVIDDAHNATIDPNVTAFLRQVIEQTAGPIRWIIASRSDAGLPVASWVGYERMDMPVTEAVLCFTLGEALAAADGVDSSDDAGEIEELLGLTGGWPVAFSIALRTATRVSDLRAARASTREMIFAYLAEQVFARLSDAERRFLLATCVYTAVDTAIVEAHAESPVTFNDVRRRVAFVSPVSETEYRYHDLFREFLESQLAPQALAAVLCEAAAVLERLGRDADALALLCRARAAGPIAGLIERTGFVLLDRGSVEIVESAIGLLSDEDERDNATILGVRAAIECNRGRFDVAERLFPTAIDRAADDPALCASLTYRYAIQLVRNDRDATALLEPLAHQQSLGAALRAAILATLATAHARVGRFDPARTAAAQALAILEPGLAGDVRARIYQQVAYVYVGAGEYELAHRYANLAIELARAHSLFEVAARASSVLYTSLLDVDRDPIERLRVLESIAELGRKTASRQVRLFALLGTYDLEADRGNAAALDALDAQVDEDPHAYPLARLQALLPAQALRLAWKGEFAGAFALLDGTGQAPDSAERRALRYAEIAVYAVAARRYDAGDAAIARALELLAAEGVKSNRRSTRARLFLALAELARGRASLAHRRIVEVERGSSHFARLHVFARALRSMYARQIGQGSDAAVTAALERLRSEQLGGIAMLLERIELPASNDAGLARLTPAERTVLGMLTRGASSKAIAADLGRSSKTVDVHIRSIARKLECSGRREAVAIAVAAGWTDPS
ncbi:MAG TPA: LuxR C-terminal-related transcriptional regulator [Candidatus Baltobacteraceae bacterium]